MPRTALALCWLCLVAQLPVFSCHGQGSGQQEHPPSQQHWDTTRVEEHAPSELQRLLATALQAVVDGTPLLLSNTSFRGVHWNVSHNLTYSMPKALQERGLAHAFLPSLAQKVSALSAVAHRSFSKALGDPWVALLAGGWPGAAAAETSSSGAKDTPSELGSIEATGKAVPGIMAMVYPDFFSKASAVAVELLKEDFRKVQLDSVTTVAHVPVVGDFRIKLKDVKLEGLSLDQTSTGVSLGEDSTFVLTIRGLNAIVDGQFQWRRTKFPFIAGQCQAQVTAKNGIVNLKVAVVGDGSGRPQITGIQAAELSFSSISIVTSGAKLSWLYNAVAALAKTPIQDAITREVSAQVTTTVPAEINKLLLGIPTTVEVKGLQLNTSLARDPSVTPDRLIVWDWGRFQNPDNHWKECPFSRQGAAVSGPVLPGGSPYMLVVNIEESVVNCLTWDLYKKGMLAHFFVGDDIPKQALYTDSWRFVIPEVYNRCPGCPMALNATVTAAPTTAIDPVSGVMTSGNAELSFFLAKSKNSPRKPWTPVQPGLGSEGAVKSEQGAGDDLGEHLFTLSLSGQLMVHDLRLERDLPDRPEGWRLNLAMKINQTALAMDVVESDVGRINKAALHLALTVAAFLIEDQVNHGILKDGFALPDVPHVQVTRTNVTAGKAALALGTDLKYAG